MISRRLLIPSMAIALFFGLSASSLVAQDAESKADSAPAAKTSKPSAASMDKKFVSEAAAGGLAEVDLGNLAKSNASDDSVKQFGDRMVTDHSKANDELKDLAQTKGWTIPTAETAKDKATRDRLAKKTGAAFDKAYIRDMVADHTMDVKEFKQCAASCSDPDLKAWAAKTAPTLEDHLKMAKDAAQKVGALTSPKSSSKSSKVTPSGEKPSGAIL